MLIASALAAITNSGFKLVRMDDFIATFERDVYSVLYPNGFRKQHVTLVQAPNEDGARLFVCCVKEGIEYRDEIGLTTPELAAFSGVRFVQSDSVYRSRRSVK